MRQSDLEGKKSLQASESKKLIYSTEYMMSAVYSVNRRCFFIFVKKQKVNF